MDDYWVAVFWSLLPTVVVSALTELDPDCCPVVAYGALLPQRVLDIPRHGWVNRTTERTMNS